MPADALTAHIAASKDAAAKDMERVVRKGGLCIFTDGSGYEGGVGRWYGVGIGDLGRGEGEF